MNAFPWPDLFVNLAVSAGAAFAVLLVAFAVGVRTGRHRGVDVAWGAGFAAVAVATLVVSTGDPVRRWTAAAMTIVWGLRLAVHIGRRNRGAPEDPRYEKLLAKAPGSRNAYALRMVYLLQGALVWFVSLPVQVAAYDPAPVSWWFYAGAAVWLLGFACEAVGDAQLAAFRSDPRNEGRILDSGLWRYTRHPNYFGDACVWWGLYLTARGTWPGAATIFSPLLMTYFLAGKTGKPMMEEHMSRRPGYADYIARTSGFLPLPPKRHAGRA